MTTPKAPPPAPAMALTQEHAEAVRQALDSLAGDGMMGLLPYDECARLLAEVADWISERVSPE